MEPKTLECGLIAASNITSMQPTGLRQVCEVLGLCKRTTVELPSVTLMRLALWLPHWARRIPPDAVDRREPIHENWYRMRDRRPFPGTAPEHLSLFEAVLTRK